MVDPPVCRRQGHSMLLKQHALSVFRRFPASLFTKQVKMIALATLLALLFAAFATCAPADTTCTSATATSSTIAPSNPTTSTSANFRLVANVTNGDLTPSIENWAISTYHITAGLDYVILEPNNVTTSRVFYINGTTAEVNHETSNILTDDGTPPTPYGLIVPPPNVTDSQGRRALELQAAPGTAGIFLSPSVDSMPHLVYDTVGLESTFYACNTTLPYGPAVVVYYRTREEATPAGCADLVLYPEW